ITLNITSVLSAKELSKKPIGLVPNPVKDFLQVYSDEKITHYEIYDASGRLMEGNTMNNSAITLNITSVLSAKELSKKPIGLVPNPVKDFLQV
ncbi:hypothetical protein BOQ60_25085, partial [Chryseobacterium sp. CH1]